MGRSALKSTRDKARTQSENVTQVIPAQKSLKQSHREWRL